MTEKRILAPLNAFIRDADGFVAEGTSHYLSEPWTVALRFYDATLIFSDETAVAVARALLRQVAENQGSDDVWATYRANITAGAVAA